MRHRDPGDAGSVAREHVYEPRRVRTHPSQATIRVSDFGPAVERGATNLLLHLEHERRSLEHRRQPSVRLREDTRPEAAEREAELERVLQMLVGVEVEARADGDEEVDDVVERELECRARLRA